jgi:Right handed beta helix region
VFAVWRVRVSLLFVVLAGVHVTGAGAGNAPLACGDVVTEDVTLDRSLHGCASGLTVGADGVTIDLNGHAITGNGAGEGVGIEAVDRTGVTVTNGAVRNFQAGVRLVGTSDSTIEQLVVRGTGDGIVVSGEGNKVVGNKVVDSGSGITLIANDSARIIGNKLHDLAGAGISCRGFGAQSDVLIEHNRSVRNEVGIGLFFCAASLLDNDASENRGVGIARTRSSGLMARNTANHNGAVGILSDDSHGLFLLNITNANGGSGLVIADLIPEHGALHTVTGHTAKRNGGLGIAALEGVIDGGGNVAKRNGDPLECLSVVCSTSG